MKKKVKKEGSSLKNAVVVVFSCRHKEEANARALRAFDWVLDSQVDPIFIFTGSEFSPPDIILKAFGANKVIWENRSKNTSENVRKTLEIARNHWIGDIRMVFVSSWYHIPRIQGLLVKRGVKINKDNFVSSNKNVKLMNVLIEPFALLAEKYDIAYRNSVIRINIWNLMKFVKVKLGYPI